MNALGSLSAIGDIARPIAVLAVVGAIAFALTAKNTAHRVTAWGVAYALWCIALCVGRGVWDDAFAVVLTFILLAIPALALAVASWMLPRGRRDTVVAEIGLLILVLIAQWIMNFSAGFDDTSGAVAIEVLYYFLFLAAAFTAAAIPVPTRRIAYGAAALSCLLLAVFRDVLLYSETGQHPDVPFNDDLLVAAVYVGIPVIGALVQIALWAKARRTRTE